MLESSLNTLRTKMFSERKTLIWRERNHLLRTPKYEEFRLKQTKFGSRCVTHTKVLNSFTLWIELAEKVRH